MSGEGFLPVEPYIDRGQPDYDKYRHGHFDCDYRHSHKHACSNFPCDCDPHDCDPHDCGSDEHAPACHAIGDSNPDSPKLHPSLG